jgi:probable O-glycosylation ligase (exosortase A-associated)
VRNYVFFLFFLPLPFLSFFRPWIGMLIWGWLSLASPHRDLWGFASTLSYNQIIAAATLAGWIVSGEFRKFRLDLTAGLLILLWVLMTVSTVNSLAPEKSWPKWDEFSKIILYALVLRSFLTTRTRIYTMIWLIVGCLGFFGVKGGVIFIVSGGSSQFYGPVGSQIGDRNSLAMAMLMGIPFMMFLRDVVGSRFIRYGLLLAVVLTVLGVIGTYSRGGFVGLAVLAAVLWLLSHRKVLMLATLLPIAALVYHVAPSAWIDRMGTIQGAQEKDASFQSRLIAWQAYAAAGLDRPLTGAGLYALNTAGVFFRYQPYETGIEYQNTKPRAAHSIYMQVLGELGVLALAVYLVMIAHLIFQCISVRERAARPPPDIFVGEATQAVLMSLVIFLVTGAALSMAFYDMLFILAAMMSALGVLNRKAIVLSPVSGSPPRSRRHPRAWAS